MYKPLAVGVASLVLLIASVGTAFADNPHAAGQTGRPDQSCEELGTPPGRSASAPGNGSPFIGESSKAGQAYSPTSQYDVACFQQSQH